ncbi:wound-induced basic protein-like isoform X2 [Cucurbita moschata]|uniref:Wound-induced basic protein-like isoform X2 n=1 Tax=Cucurbita moschata TaxID=3662 RepID=A0A6J1H6H7_CUCMO|nr:wound-induced basic protein-like isoform X2 [Cucurbita moschata]
MIYDVNSSLFRSFLSQKGGSSDRWKMEQKPKEQRPKASENKPVMSE